jgi:hypothetical protein
MTYELKTFELVLNMLKFNLEGSLNFERTPIKLQKSIKSKNNNGEKSLGEVWGGAWDQGSLIFWAVILVDLRHRIARKTFMRWFIWAIHKMNLNFIIWQYCLVDVKLVPWEC